MKAHKTKIGLLLCIFALALFSICLINRRRSNPPNAGLPQDRFSHLHSSDHTLKKTDPVVAWIAAYRTPIEFYGKVVDQYGDPVIGASIMVLPFDNAYGESKTQIKLTSDADGRFSIKGIKGAGMGVEVKKPGYLTKSDLGPEKPASSRLIENALDDREGIRFKDPNKPILFTLHKLGPMEPMVYVTERRWKLPANGTARSIALDTEKGLGSHQIEFQFTTEWAKIPKDSDALFGMFDWKLEMRIPGGGFCRSKSDYVFEAPESGYEERILMNHPKSTPGWSKVDSGRYFVRFPDGTHGRIRYTIEGNSDTAPLLLTSWMNLKPGSRNLNSDKRDSNLMLDE